jgi:hypothetical protein
MRENVGIWPAGQIKPGAGGQKIKTSLGYVASVFPIEPCIQCVPQAV